MPIMAAPPSPVSALAYHPAGKFLYAGLNGAVAVVDSERGEVASHVPGFEQRVTALKFSSDGKSLAIASGLPGRSGIVRLYSVDEKTGALSAKAEFSSHKDVVYALEFSPDGKRLASAGYDRIIMIWNVAGGSSKSPSQQLKDHSDTVYGLAWHPQGKLLASAAADRAVKVWEVASGKRLYTLGDPTDWVYSVTWNPDGRLLAAGGVDKSIRVWQADAEGGKLVNSVFAHTTAVTKLIYSTDGKSLYSLSEGKNLKKWDSAKMVEQLVFPPQTETLLSMALRLDGKQLAVGRFDGVLQLLDPTTGKLIAQPMPEKPKPPTIGNLAPSQAKRGETVQVVVRGRALSDDLAVASSLPGVVAKLIPGGSDSQRTIELTIPPTVQLGPIPLVFKTAGGSVSYGSFFADRFPVAVDSAGNDSARRAKTLALPASIVGAITRAGEADYFRFEAKAGQEIGIQLTDPLPGSKLDPVLELTDVNGNVLAEGTKLVAHQIARDGIYAIGIRDKEYRGGSDFTYRLHAGNIPIITRILPMGVPRGKSTKLTLVGVNLPVKEIKFPVAETVQPGESLQVTIPGMMEQPVGERSVIAGEYHEVVDGGSIPVPGTANGAIAKPGQTDTWNFKAKKGERLILEVNARRLGSGLDSYIEILDDKDRPLGRATLRCVARTFVAFRDHDANSSAIRLETWNELAMGDYVYVGNELLRIFNLPPNPDADCSFYSVSGVREGQLDTTPGHHPMGAPMYKVELHPPGVNFPPNGMPIFRLNYRNDDGGPLYGKDSRIFFDPPVTGTYRVRIGDSRGMGRPDFGYRLTVRLPIPDFKVSFSPGSPTVTKGGSASMSVSIVRLDGFQGPVKLKLENLPLGFESPETYIEEGQTTANFALFATPSAEKSDPNSPIKLKIKASAMVEGHELVHEATGGLPVLTDPGDIVTMTTTDSVSVKPGEQTRLKVKIERRNGFKGRIPLEVRGLPYGVRVLDIGLNGILITEKDTERDVVIYAEPWVTPKAMPFVVLARHEAKGTEHGAKSVLLKVAK